MNNTINEKQIFTARQGSQVGKEFWAWKYSPISSRIASAL
jgi:hypothetical protein